MGCGSSRAIPAVPENLLSVNPGESSRRKKNAAGKHSHLQNAIDESVDALALFRQYAIQNKRPWQDWKAFAHDDHDNFAETAFREAATQMAQVEELQSQAHLDYIRSQNVFISTNREILQELKIYDEFVLNYNEAVTKEREAKRLVMVAQDKLERAKPKPNFETQKPILEAAIKDREAAHIAAERAVDTARHNREDQAHKMREAKARLTLKSLTEWHAGNVKLHEASLAALAKHKEIIDKLQNTPRDPNPPLPPDTTDPAAAGPAAAAGVATPATPATPAVAAAAATSGSGSRPGSRPGTPRTAPTPAPAPAPTPAPAPAPAAAAAVAPTPSPTPAAEPASRAKNDAEDDDDDVGTGGADSVRKESKA